MNIFQTKRLAERSTTTIHLRKKECKVKAKAELCAVSHFVLFSFPHLVICIYISTMIR